jgi:pyridoxal phosphate enzyme (YggS family)
MSFGAQEVAANVAEVGSRIAAACARSGRAEGDVTLIGVTKGQPVEAIRAGLAAGLRDFGENYLQEALPKIEALEDAAARPRFHFIGHLQSNKAKGAAGRFAILHGVDSPRLLRALANAAHAPIEVMLQVNIAAEATKHGVAPAELGALLAEARGLLHVRVTGLMTIPPPAAGPEASRPYFRALRELAREHGLEKLSMGMTDDFEVAIEEGATHVRVGRAIFGERR